jgi:hypothetical protein
LFREILTPFEQTHILGGTDSKVSKNDAVVALIMERIHREKHHDASKYLDPGEFYF